MIDLRSQAKVDAEARDVLYDFCLENEIAYPHGRLRRRRVANCSRIGTPTLELEVSLSQQRPSTRLWGWGSSYLTGDSAHWWSQYRSWIVTEIRGFHGYGYQRVHTVTSSRSGIEGKRKTYVTRRPDFHFESRV